MDHNQRRYRRMTDDEEKAFSRLYPTIKEELSDRFGIYTFQQGPNIVIELEENITMSKQRFFRIVAEYKRLRQVRRNQSRHSKHWTPRPSPLNPQNGITRATKTALRQTLEHQFRIIVEYRRSLQS